MKADDTEGKAEKGSHKWLQKLINENASALNAVLKQILDLPQSEKIDWLSPLEKENYEEYYNEAFLEKLGLSVLIPDLRKFWPKGGPHWDGMGKSSSQKVFMVEAKSHISELISSLRAIDQYSRHQIQESLNRTKRELGSKTDSDWSKTYYQYANRLAHVHFLRQNGVDAYFVSVYFLNDAEMNGPKTIDEWRGALRSLHRYLDLEEDALSKFVIEVFIDINDL